MSKRSRATNPGSALRTGIAELVDRFVEDIQQVIVTATMDALHGLFAPVPRPTKRKKGSSEKPAAARRRSSSSRRQTASSRGRGGKKLNADLRAGRAAGAPMNGTGDSQTSTSLGEAVLQGEMTPSSKPRRRVHTWTPSTIVAQTDAGKAENALTTERTTTPSEREAAVLEAVRVLVRATAGEVAKACELANGTTYVALRSLVASQKIAKTESSRGIEYSLVSTGKVQPFKRVMPKPPATPPVATAISASPVEVGQPLPSMTA